MLWFKEIHCTERHNVIDKDTYTTTKGNTDRIITSYTNTIGSLMHSTC